MTVTSRNAELAEELRAYARGSLPLMAAVDFVAATGTDLAPMVAREHEYGNAYLDVFVDDERSKIDPTYLTTAQWRERVGPMSGGQRATWELARSIVDGELDEWFWRLDTHRKLAFTTALLSTALVVGPNGQAVAAVEP